MYQSVNDGTLTNNVKFSKCSVAYVEPVLTAKSFKCFERSGTCIYTGNDIVCPMKLSYIGGAGATLSGYILRMC